jgi:hypothetical protein
MSTQLLNCNTEWLPVVASSALAGAASGLQHLTDPHSGTRSVRSRWRGRAYLVRRHGSLRPAPPLIPYRPRPAQGGTVMHPTTLAPSGPPRPS